MSLFSQTTRFLLKLRRSLQRPALSMELVLFVVSVFFTLFCNDSFWHQALATHAQSGIFAFSLGCLLVACHAFILGLLVWRWNAKIVLTLLLLVTAVATHFISTFHVYINVDMVRNVLHTDHKESHELITIGLIWPLIGYALIPIAALWWIRIRPVTLIQSWLRRCLYLLLCPIVAGVGALFSSQDIAALVRNHREIRYLATPFNYLAALYKTVQSDSSHGHRPKLPIGLDASRLPRQHADRPRLVVIILGETARAQNFGLAGYRRQTTPELAARADLINFPDAHSCGTSTEVSVPCLFSPYGRHDYHEETIRQHQSLLHLLERVQVATLWRDNQSGCKGVCDGLALDQIDDAKDPLLCHDGRCMDEILLSHLAEKIREKTGDRLIVLHQLGSHGPSYFQRYPPEFRRFTPTCETSDLGQCRQQQIINTYDNTLAYTDHFINQTIERLAQLTDYDAMLIYLSDHGESLGEKGLYLHGVPYAIAPKEQTHIPMLLWFSPHFLQDYPLSDHCIRQRARQYADHDNLFPTVLGLFQIRTSLYDRNRDLLAKCRQEPAP